VAGTVIQVSEAGNGATHDLAKTLRVFAELVAQRASMSLKRDSLRNAVKQNGNTFQRSESLFPEFASAEELRRNVGDTILQEQTRSEQSQQAHEAHFTESSEMLALGLLRGLQQLGEENIAKKLELDISTLKDETNQLIAGVKSQVEKHSEVIARQGKTLANINLQDVGNKLELEKIRTKTLAADSTQGSELKDHVSRLEEQIKSLAEAQRTKHDASQSEASALREENANLRSLLVALETRYSELSHELNQHRAETTNTTKGLQEALQECRGEAHRSSSVLKDIDLVALQEVAKDLSTKLSTTEQRATELEGCFDEARRPDGQLEPPSQLPRPQASVERLEVTVTKVAEFQEKMAHKLAQMVDEADARISSLIRRIEALEARHSALMPTELTQLKGITDKLIQDVAKLNDRVTPVVDARATASGVDKDHEATSDNIPSPELKSLKSTIDQLLQDLAKIGDRVQELTDKQSNLAETIEQTRALQKLLTRVTEKHGKEIGEVKESLKTANSNLAQHVEYVNHQYTTLDVLLQTRQPNPNSLHDQVLDRLQESFGPRIDALSHILQELNQGVVQRDRDYAKLWHDMQECRNGILRIKEVAEMMPVIDLTGINQRKRKRLEDGATSLGDPATADDGGNKVNGGTDSATVNGGVSPVQDNRSALPTPAGDLTQANGSGRPVSVDQRAPANNLVQVNGDGGLDTVNRAGNLAPGAGSSNTALVNGDINPSRAIRGRNRGPFNGRRDRS
jgi:chromosome segregation ATPase